jgi:hypothetical protein
VNSDPLSSFYFCFFFVTLNILYFRYIYLYIDYKNGEEEKTKTNSIKMLQQQHKIMVETNLPSSMLKVRISIFYACFFFEKDKVLLITITYL